MKALQQITKHQSMTDAQEYMMIMSEQEGFLGGRVLLGNRTQLFFDCDQDMSYGLLYEGSEERIIKVMNSQRLAVGIGNPHSHIPHIVKTETVKTEEAKEDEKEVTTGDWLKLAEETRLAWVRYHQLRNPIDHANFIKLQKISHNAHDVWARQLKESVYG